MSWLRIDDAFWSNPKVIAAGNEAAGVYVRALAYCAAHSTDGEIPADVLKFIAGGKRKMADKLTESGLLERTNAGFRAPDFLDFNPSKDEVQERRKQDAERQRRHRSRKGSRGESRRDSERSPSVPSRPVPSSPTEKTPQPPKGEGSDPVAEVFAYWQQTLGKPDHKLTADRRRKVRARLDEGYSVADLKAAIDGIATSDFHRGKNDQGREYLGLELICRNGSKVDEFRDMARAKVTPIRPAAAGRFSEYDAKVKVIGV